MCGVGALVEGPVCVGEAVAPGVQPGQDLAAPGRIAGRRQGGDEVETYAGSLQVFFDVSVPSSGAQLTAPDRLRERSLDGSAA